MSKSKQKGLTLIELMIAMIIGILIIGGVIGMFVTSVRSNADHIKMIELNQEMRVVMSLITRELRMANADEAAFNALPNVYLCDACDVTLNTVDGNQTLAFSFNGDNKSFAINGDVIVFDNGANPEGLTMPEHNYSTSSFTVWKLYTSVADGTRWENQNYAIQADDTDEDQIKVDINLVGSTEISGGDIAQRRLIKTVRVRN
ncbi:PilW family protein [Methylophaga sp. OBS3]|uniref:PilW family protein n=1 Tax=Methylophaga sp. OBS3 TaxID=2991934 RepID=UPI0022553979|nr:prepilin-type N-terminal cleavage/methylation domain-containing protein [Methylophaga sp. OBS3]MCX4190368.1 prepilin-type N-terminal cleavage/methylation domain-containing protein [Methylophaga sp. OBS3]